MAKDLSEPPSSHLFPTLDTLLQLYKDTNLLPPTCVTSKWSNVLEKLGYCKIQVTAVPLV